MQSQTSKLSNQEIGQRLQIYQLLSSYYLEGVHSLSIEQIEAIKGGVYGDRVPIRAACQLVADGLLINNDLLLMETFDYNRLFVGPGKVLASPYESAYRSAKRLLMQKQTLEVRSFYQRLGIENRQEGSLPDDHLGLELEFVSYLLYQMLYVQEQPELFYEYYCEFIEKHVLQWAISHCDRVIDHSKTSLCKGMGILLKGMLEYERQTIAKRQLQTI